MPSDYQKQIKEIFGTSDLDELRELAKMLKINNPNPRNAGRKAQLTPDQIVEVLELHRKGIGDTEIAKSSACRARPYISISITPSISARTRISPCG